MSFISQSHLTGSAIEPCYFCGNSCPRSSSFNIPYGYTTVFCCTIECKTVISAFLYACNKKYPFDISDRCDAAIDHFCYSRKCRSSDYNLNVSLLKRLIHYYISVRYFSATKNYATIDSLMYDNRDGDIWSHDDPFSDSYSDDLP
jgi:hypothetical protein